MKAQKGFPKKIFIKNRVAFIAQNSGQNFLNSCPSPHDQETVMNKQECLALNKKLFERSDLASLGRPLGQPLNAAAGKINLKSLTFIASKIR